LKTKSGYKIYFIYLKIDKTIATKKFERGQKLWQNEAKTRPSSLDLLRNKSAK
jgi:hypothetical protein